MNPINRKMEKQDYVSPCINIIILPEQASLMEATNQKIEGEVNQPGEGINL